MDDSQSRAEYAHLSSTDISVCYTNCLTLFKRLLMLFNNPSSSALHFEEVFIGRVLDEYGRIRTWGEETRAALPAASRGSLDNTLRKNDALKSTVTGILSKIQRQVGHAIRTVETALEGGYDSLQSSIMQDSDTDECSESSSDDDNENEEPQRTPTARTLLLIFRHIKEDTTSLYQISLMISRPGFNRQYVHSTGQKTWDSRVAYYAEFDVRYVEEKVLSWRGQQITEPDEPTATPDILQDRITLSGFSNSLKILTRRLARANTRRREQLLYWSKYPDQLPTAAVINTEALEKQPDPAVRGDALPIALPDILTRDTESQGPRSTMTRTTFSTVVMSDLLGTQTEAGPERTIYAESTVGNKRTNRVPEVPSAAVKHESFECPYCHLTLDSKQMRNRLEWKRHVFRDLRPYVCTFEDCQNQDKQYQTRHDWVYHEMQIHRRQWVCEEHNISFSAKQLFIQHISESHSKSVTSRQLPILVEMSERFRDSMEIVSCPLCPDERRLTTLHGHLAEHLESISLFALPTSDFEGDEENDNDTGTAAGNLSSRRRYSQKSSSSNSSRISFRSASGHLGKDLMYCAICRHEWQTGRQQVFCPQCDSTSIQPLDVPTINLRIYTLSDRIELPNLPATTTMKELHQMIHDKIPSRPAIGSMRLYWFPINNDVGKIIDPRIFDDRQLIDIFGLDRIRESKEQILSLKIQAPPTQDLYTSQLESENDSTSGKDKKNTAGEIIKELKAKEPPSPTLSTDFDFDSFLWAGSKKEGKARATDSEQEVTGSAQNAPAIASKGPEQVHVEDVPPFPPARSSAVQSQPTEDGRRLDTTSPSPWDKPLPSCPRAEPTAGFEDWYGLFDQPDFDICPTCYEGVFADSPYSTYFSPVRRSKKIRRFCDFSSVWMRMAWLLTLKQRRQSLDLLYGLAKVDETVRPCPSDRGWSTEHVAWYGIRDQRNGLYVTNFAICPGDVQRVETLLPRLQGYFTRLPESADRLLYMHACSLRVSSHRFPKYLDLLIELDTEASSSGQKANMSRFVDLARDMASKTECVGGKALFNQLWYFMPELPDFTVCEECFHEVVQPILASSTNLTLPRHFNRTMQTVPNENPEYGTTCCLYSERMRKIWQRSVQLNDVSYLKQMVVERKRAEQDFSQERQGILDEMRGFERESVEWRVAKENLMEAEKRWKHYA